MQVYLNFNIADVTSNVADIMLFESLPSIGDKSAFLCGSQSYTVKAGVNLKAVFWLVIMALTQISRLSFKQSRISMHAHYTYLCFGLFCKFFGDF